VEKQRKKQRPEKQNKTEATKRRRSSDQKSKTEVSGA
jgi:hypothetical protein